MYIPVPIWNVHDATATACGDTAQNARKCVIRKSWEKVLFSVYTHQTLHFRIICGLPSKRPWRDACKVHDGRDAMVAMHTPENVEGTNKHGYLQPSPYMSLVPIVLELHENILTSCSLQVYLAASYKRLRVFVQATKHGHTVVSQVSVHLRMSATCTYIYTLYVQTASPCKRPPPIIWPVNFKRPHLHPQAHIHMYSCRYWVLGTCTRTVWIVSRVIIITLYKGKHFWQK